MTKVTHAISSVQLAKDIADPIFLLTNGAGTHLTLENTPTSRYQGGFFNHKFEVYKVLENIFPTSAGPITELRNTFWNVERKRGKLTEKFFLPPGIPGIVYELSEEREIQLDLDCRKIFDFRQFGRYYAVSQEGGKTCITFTKKTDTAEDRTSGKREFSITVVLNSAAFFPIGAFAPTDYAYDRSRGTIPPERYIYQAGTVRTKKLVLTFNTDKWKALRDNREIERRLGMLQWQAQSACTRSVKKFADPEQQLAYAAALQSVQSLVQKIGGEDGIYAGIYWFPQFWARDEAIALKGLMLAGKYAMVKELIWKQLSRITSEGYLPNRKPAAGLKSADAAGWWWKRTGDFIDLLSAHKLLNRYLPKKDLMFLKRQLRKTISGLQRTHLKEGLILNGPRETWMDTEWNGDVRAGARIEIQAAFLNMHRLLAHLCGLTGEKLGKRNAALKEHAMLQRVRKVFLDGLLKDGSDDATVRPNLFLAHSLYPKLLSTDQWKRCFLAALPKLWNDWGGLASIDKEHPLYCSEYTGEGNQSYHRGDSWLWVNHLAAIAMLQVDRKKFAPYITKILEASTHELLWSGIVGHSAELSSSARLESKGCFAQAWSAATYAELIAAQKHK